MDASDRKEDAQLTLNGMATQLGINAAIALGVLFLFNILRPNNSLVYAPKYKYASKTKQPPHIGHGFFAWFGPVLYTPDEILIEKIGYDATLFIRFLRMIRRMLYIMTFVGVIVILPVNIIATSRTGEWPPAPGLEFLSISTINYYDGKFHYVNGDLGWYWCHTIGTWLFSIIIYVFLWLFYVDYVKFRKSYFESEEYQKSMNSKTLMIFNVPPSMRSDKALADWVNGMGLKYPAQQICIGTQNVELGRLVQEHEDAVRNLEIILSNHLKDGHVVPNKKRPLMRINGYFGCFGGTKVDAINYYSELVQNLDQKITEARKNISTSKKTSYGWISYERVEWAHANAKYLASSASPLRSIPKLLTEGSLPTVELAPQPKDIIWSNLAMNEHVRRSKRLVVTIIFYCFVFFWFIPSSFLSASNNVKDFFRMTPQTKQFMKHHPMFVSLLSSWFTPIVMAIFFFILPMILRFMSQQQGYMTGTSLDRQVLAKLFVFFIVNNLLVFTISSTLLSIYTEIKQAVDGGNAISASEFFGKMADNLTNVVKNLSDVSTYWVNYVSLKGLGVIVDLAQVVVLLKVTVRKLFTQPSPRQLQEFTRPSPFDYPLFYNILLFFFTVGLVYSVIAPLVLPFTLMYFLLATMVFKYLLMYVFVTHVETGGQIWRLLFNRILVSTVLFQVIMLAVLYLKSAHTPALVLVPLPIITLIYKWVCTRRFDHLVYYYTPEREKQESQMSYPPSSPSPHKNSVVHRFGDPAFFSELPVPMIHERVRHLLPKLYGQHSETSKKAVTSRMTRKKSVRHVSVIHLQNNPQGLQFQSVTDKELELDDSTEGITGMYKFNEDIESENVVDPPDTSYYSDSFSSQPYSASSASPIRRFSQRIQQTIQSYTGHQGHQNDMYSPTRPLVSQSSESYTKSPTPHPPLQHQMSEDMEYFVAGRAYRSHNPHNLGHSADVIELANIYRAEQQPYHPHHHPSLHDNYNHYVRNPIAAYTTGHGKQTNHPEQMHNPSQF